MSFGFEEQQAENIAIDQNSGWPALSTAEFKADRRIPEQFSETAIADSLNRSVAEVQQQLLKVAADREVPFKLDENQVPQFSELQVSLYRGAVYSRSHGDLLSYFSTVDHKEDKDITESKDNMLANSNKNIRLLLGKGRVGVHSL